MMIKLENVKKSFNKRKKNRIDVINNTTLEFSSSGLVALLGPSGSGKTTLLNVIGGLDKIDSGDIYIDDEKITKVSTKKIDKIRNLNIGYIFQDYKLIENMTVYDNVSIVLKMIGIKDKEEIEKRVLYTLKKVGMERYKRRPVTMLSGGERQRVGIARALVKDPKIIIADEPTGNLDSKNSIEVMNIIKNISKNRLVILVTHEVELAKFYASRIIEIKDGVVINDYENNEKRTLDYRIENKIYLKDFKEHEIIKKNDIEFNVYSDHLEKIKIDLIFKNGNLYINTNTNDLVRDKDNIEIIDGHYEEIEEFTEDEKLFNISEVSDKNYSLKYSSIFNLGNFVSNGFKKILDYPVMKKILLLGFLIAGAFIFYSISSSMAAINFKDEDFVKLNKEYMVANINRLNSDEVKKIENIKGIDYILPSDSVVSFNMIFNDYYQAENYSENFEGSISDINNLDKDKLISGTLPSNNKEIVIDKLITKNILNKGLVRQIGVADYKDFIGRTVTIPLMGEFKIVGISDTNGPNVYTSKELFIDLINNMLIGLSEEMDVEEASLANYDLVKDKIKIVEGKSPVNKYEIIVSSSMGLKIGDKADLKVDNHALKIVGIYDGEYSNYFSNVDTVKEYLFTTTNKITVMTKNGEEAKSEFLKENIELKSSYENSKKQYIDSKKEDIKMTFLVSGIILLISLVEIFLMIRSSFLSRVKEVGVYRAIGVKKSDIYKMFAGEVIAITTLSSLTGILLMAYLLGSLTKIEMIKNFALVNPFTVIVSVIIVYIFNILVGLLPVYTTIRKMPAEILSRQDV